MILNAMWGRKVGMTQVFSAEDYRAIPVTVISIGQWHVLQKKTIANDGYNSIQVGLLRKKYRALPFLQDWCKKKSKFFLFVKEIRCQDMPSFEIGDVVVWENLFQPGEMLKIIGTTIGKGFQGVVKRYKFTGGRASHGDKLGRHPGSLSGLRTQGMVFKGKKMPGRMGGMTKTINNLCVVEVKSDAGLILLKGSVPGKSGSLVYMSKHEEKF